MEPVEVILSLGSNTGDRADNLARARAALAARPGVHMIAESSIRETEPVDVPVEFAHMKFLNQIVIAEVAEDAFSFSTAIHAIEADLGRVRGTVRNAPRPIDIDIITFGTCVSHDPALTLPHPRARERAFVMEPLTELRPAFRWPDE